MRNQSTSRPRSKSCIILAVVLAALVAAVSLVSITGPTLAANNGNNANSGNGNGNTATGASQTIYLKGSGSSFKEKWKNVFTVGVIPEGSTPNVWHLVYSGKVFNAVTEMQLTFTNGEIFKWTPAMGPSVNGGGNNFGWVIQAPYDWEIAYVNKGNSNDSGSFLKTTEAGNVNFNISGFDKGSPPVKPPRPPKPPKHVCELHLTYFWRKALDYCVTYPQALWTIKTWNQLQGAIDAGTIFLRDLETCVCDINNMIGTEYDDMMALSDAIQNALNAMDYALVLDKDATFAALTKEIAFTIEWMEVVGAYPTTDKTSAAWLALVAALAAAEQAVVDARAATDPGLREWEPILTKALTDLNAAIRAAAG